jgi:subtilase family serine protease
MQHLAARIRAFNFFRSSFFFAALLPSFLMWSPVEAQFAVGPSRPMVVQPINESDLVVLPGNTRPEARVPANDQGLVADDMPLPHIMLQLRRPAAQEQALVALIDALHDRNSPDFHHWLTAAEIGERFGPAASDIEAVTGWLSRHGFTINTVYTNKMVIDFSGTAGQVGAAFHTEIHHLLVNGVAHLANISDPRIPAALAPAVVGTVSLHDFMPSAASLHHDIPANANAAPTLTDGITQYISPGDIATIYNFRPMFASKINGQGQTIYVVGNSQMYRPDDWSDFRTSFGIPNTSYVNVSLSFELPQPPSGPNNCVNPGVNNSDAEATLDVEYASAGAPGANIVLAACSDSNGLTSGILIAVQNLVNGASPPAIMSISYQHCEAVAGATMNAAINTAYQTGVAEGMSIYVAAGDQGGSLCTNEGADATTGFGVNAFAATPYNVAVGGTDFENYYLGENSTYWNSSNAAD